LQQNIVAIHEQWKGRIVNGNQEESKEGQEALRAFSKGKGGTQKASPKVFVRFQFGFPPAMEYKRFSVAGQRV
jgi:hypothetical protein